MKIQKNLNNNKWILIDAENKVLGRLASKISLYLTGKNNINYRANVVSGYSIVIINAKKILVTGKKLNNKVYYKHSGYPGGMKKIILKDLISKNIQLVIKNAVKGMLPKNKLQKIMLKRLRIFPYAEHIHASQKPEKIEL